MNNQNLFIKKDNKYINNNNIYKKLNTNNNLENLKKNESQNKFLTNELTTEEKMFFYNCTINGDLDKFKKLIEEKKYNIFEEVSAPGHNWTNLHYAMHYGKWNIIKYILTYLISINKLESGLKLKSIDKRCPLLCLLKSNALSDDIKRDIFTKIVNNFIIHIINEVKKELIKRGLDDLIDKIRPYD